MHATPRPRADALERLLAPVGVEQFVGRYADRRALLVEGGPEKLADLAFDVEAFFTATERFEPGAGRLKAAGPAEGEAERYVPIEPQQARGLFQAGLTICAAGLSDVEPALGAMAEGVRLALSVPDLRFNAYLSPDGSGFNLHYDVQPIFLVQVAGAKRWWYGAEPVTPMPGRYSSAWREKPALESLEQTLLEPGDVLYLPAFTWHRARASGFSLGITLGTKGGHNEPLRSLLEESPFAGPWPVGAMQPPLAPEAIPPEGVPEAARPYLEEQLGALRRFVAGLTVDELWTRWVEQVQRPLGPRPAMGDDNVTSEDTLERTRGFPAHLTVGAGGCSVRHATRTLAFPAETAPLLRWVLAQAGPFAARDALAIGADCSLTRAEAKRVLRDLAAAGILARRRP